LKSFQHRNKAFRPNKHHSLAFGRKRLKPINADQDNSESFRPKALRALSHDFFPEN